MKSLGLWQPFMFLCDSHGLNGKWEKQNLSSWNEHCVSHSLTEWVDTVITKERKSEAAKLLLHRPFEVTMVGKHITHSVQHARMVTCTIVSLFVLSIFFFCLSSVAIVSCNSEHFNDRNLVLFSSADWADIDAKTFLELVVFPSWLRYFTVLLLSLFSLPVPSSSFLNPPEGDCQHERTRRRESEKETD